jgi:hypothetical protein
MEKRAWTAFTTAHALLYRRLEQRLKRDHGLSGLQYEILVSITSPDSQALQVAADIRPGWNVTIRGTQLGKRSATFTRREGGKVVEQLRFAAV